jgi:hypothetical protein
LEIDEAPLPFRRDDGPVWRLDLHDYQGAGGLAALLSDHADEVMKRAARNSRRKRIVEHLFRALTDINAEGQAIRCPQTFAELAAVTGGDGPTLRDILDRFRADGVWFLTPYGDVAIGPDTLIDISHEALIRCWSKIAGDKDGKDGWLQREFRDGLAWKTLRMQAQTGETLSAAATEARDAWLDTLPSHRWTERYDNAWDDVDRLMIASRKTRDEELQRKREFEEAKRREAEARAQRAEEAHRAAEEIAAKQQQLRQAQERIATEQLQRAEAEQQRAEEAEAHAKEAEAGRRRSRRLAIIAGSLAFAALVAAGIASWSWWQADRALVRAVSAEAAEKTARNEAQVGDSLFRAVQARERLDDDLPVTAIQLALTGLPDRPEKPEARPWVAETASVLAEALGKFRGLLVLRGHEDEVNAAAFSRDGARIVSGSDDQTVRVWDAASGAELLVVRGHEGTVYAAAFSPDGAHIVSGSSDSTVRVTWVARTKQELIETARATLPRQLTSEERRRFYLATE